MIKSNVIHADVPLGTIVGAASCSRCSLVGGTCGLCMRMYACSVCVDGVARVLALVSVYTCPYFFFSVLTLV